MITIVRPIFRKCQPFQLCMMRPQRCKKQNWRIVKERAPNPGTWFSRPWIHGWFWDDLWWFWDDFGMICDDFGMILGWFVMIISSNNLRKNEEPPKIAGGLKAFRPKSLARPGAVTLVPPLFKVHLGWVKASPNKPTIDENLWFFMFFFIRKWCNMSQMLFECEFLDVFGMKPSTFWGWKSWSIPDLLSISGDRWGTTSAVQACAPREARWQHGGPMIALLQMGLSENVVYPEKPNGFADHYPVFKWL